MSDTFKKVKNLVKAGEIVVSEHGYDEISQDNIFVKDIMAGIENAVLVEDYPDYHKGPCVLLLQYDHEKQPIHVVWGIPRARTAPAVVVTAYRPDHTRWSEDFMRRKR